MSTSHVSRCYEDGCPIPEVRVINPVRVSGEIDNDQELEAATPPAKNPKIYDQPKKFSWGRVKRVLRNVFNNPIMDFVITITPKPFKTMLKWLKARFKEPTTYKGVTALAGAIGWYISPEMWEAVAAMVISLIGLIQVIENEGKKNKQ